MVPVGLGLEPLGADLVALPATTVGETLIALEKIDVRLGRQLTIMSGTGNPHEHIGGQQVEAVGKRRL